VPGEQTALSRAERSRRTDADEVYRRARVKSTEEFAKQLARWQHEYNHRRLHLALGGRAPAERLRAPHLHAASCSTLSMTRLVKIEGSICPRIDSSAASLTVASPEKASPIETFLRIEPTRVFNKPFGPHNTLLMGIPRYCCSWN
jgi:hypothetical protein